MNPTPHIIPSALLLLAAFFIGCLVGYLLKRMLGSSPQTARAVQPDATAPSAAHDLGDPALGLLDGPIDGKADDLKKIKGIGPKLESVLHDNGVYHFSQIAAWNAKSIAIMNARLSFKGRIEREKWVSQAKALARAGKT
jgi:predicted flap endonuclease-1-like 5' DNA nuclease